MPNYSNGKIYKIVCNITGKIYIGSTVSTLSRRLSQHKSLYKCYLKGITRFMTSFDIIKEDDYKIVLIENVNCSNKEDLTKRERFYIENFDCVNKIIPTRTIKEYKEKNREKQIIYNINFWKNNQNKMREYYLKYRDKKTELYYCDCGSKVTREHKSHHFKTKKHIAYLESLNN